MANIHRMEVKMPDPRIFPIERANDGHAGVTDVSIIIVPANEHRADLKIVNDLDVVVYLARGNVAVVGDGMRLNANGGAFNMDTQDLFLGYITAICNPNEDGSVTISEGEWQ